MSNEGTEAIASELLEIQRTLGWMDLVISNITDAVYVTDNNSHLVFVNQFFADLLEMPRVFLLGEVLKDVFPIQKETKPQQEFLANVEEELVKNGSGVAIYRWQKGNRDYIFKVSHRNINTIGQTVYIAKDITREHEESILKTNFVNIASHQLRTPMTAIMTYAHMLYDGYGGPLNDKQKNLTNTVITSSERMIRLINDILLITRIQNGETELIKKNSNLGDILKSIKLEYQPRFASQGIDYKQKFNAEISTRRCNKFVMHEIISNIVSNAIQYTPSNGRIRLTAQIEQQLVIISIEDNGIGIPKAELPKIFEQFSRAQNAFEAYNEGTGLGLYVVKLLIGQINGTISCDSKVNQGTIFRIAFPAD